MTTNSVSLSHSSRPATSHRSLHWINGTVHWISAVVLVYALYSNGTRNRALVDPSAMRGEVKLGLFVGALFLLRFVWVKRTRSRGGRWLPSSVVMSRSFVRRISDFAIYLGVAASVASGLLIAYLRPGVAIVPLRRGFLTNSQALNAAIDFHSFASNSLIWLCAFHAAHSLLCIMKGTRWGSIAAVRLEKLVSAARALVR